MSTCAGCETASRRVGGDGNPAATDFLARMIASFGFGTEFPAFECVDWTEEGVTDARSGTPGASDNAGGTTVLLLLAELLADYPVRLGLERNTAGGGEGKS